MSEDSKQLSVAELLARNGQQGSSSGGGRRRRGGRGISVAELTGDLPVIRDGGAHSAPDAEAAHEPAESPGDSPMSGPITRYDPLAPATSAPPAPAARHGVPGSDDDPAAAPAPSTGRSGRRRKLDPDDNATVIVGRPTAGVGPASFAAPPQAFEPPAPPSFEPPAPPSFEPPAPPSFEPANSQPLPAPRAFEPPAPPAAPAPVPLAPPPQAGPTQSADRPGPDSGRLSRADRRRAAEVTEIYPAPIAPADEPSPPATGWAPPPPDFGPAPRPLSPMPPRPGPDARAPEPPARGRGGLPAWSARRRNSAAPPGPPAPAGPPGSPVPHGAPAPESGAIPTQAWSLASQDQQLLSGQTVAGDLLRDGAERADAARRAGREQRRSAPAFGPPPPGFGGPPSFEKDRRGRDDYPGEDFEQGSFGEDYPDEDYPGEDFEQNSFDEDYDREFDDGEFFDTGEHRPGPYGYDEDYTGEDLEPIDYDDEPPAKGKRSISGLASRVKSVKPARLTGVKGLSGAAALVGAKRAGGENPKGKRRGEPAAAQRDPEAEANRRQWMILGAQSTGAAIAGMLMFKGFERMWEMLPWVALTLAMIVILGLVALVRILRHTDDILSTVIAVVVGIFVTLGPLAFLLSTN
ncbi:hypothetical protein [Nocardia shimofusensis]|uniref:hypothetical protein n=1 Tax=Nocardia shimofusensis TaxID=228596 RepID=UPI000831B763|nr:hypothetical protein [Nocardia shimofusensis]